MAYNRNNRNLFKDYQIPCLIFWFIVYILLFVESICDNGLMLEKQLAYFVFYFCIVLGFIDFKSMMFQNDSSVWSFLRDNALALFLTCTIQGVLP